MLLVSGVVSPGASVRAEEMDPDLGGMSVDVHGFVSQGAIYTTENNYLAKSERGSFDFSEVGINFTSQVTDNLRVGLQLFSRDLGTSGNYNAKMDWYYLDYRWADWLGLRAGRVKLPFGLYNEINDVDAARTPILLPESIYSTTSRDFLLAQTGFELYGYLPLGPGGALDYRVYGGTIHVDPGRTIPPAFIAEVDTPYVVGGRLIWETPLDGLRFGGSLQALRLNTSVYLDPARWMALGEMPPPDARFSLELPAILSVASVEYLAGDLLLSAEYGRWNVDTESGLQALVPSSDLTSERFYALAAYRLTSWFQPSAYYSFFYPNVEDRVGVEAWRHDFAATLRFDINSHWIVKIEAHYMHGTAGLNQALNDGTPAKDLAKNWSVFLAKTTAYF